MESNHKHWSSNLSDRSSNLGSFLVPFRDNDLNLCLQHNPKIMTHIR